MSARPEPATGARAGRDDVRAEHPSGASTEDRAAKREGSGR